MHGFQQCYSIHGSDISTSLVVFPKNFFHMYQLSRCKCTRYKRVFSVGTEGITTYNPGTLEVTNQWQYEDFLSIRPSEKSAGEFSMTMKKSHKKTDTMKFSTDHRADLLTEALRFHSLFTDKTFKIKVIFSTMFFLFVKKLSISKYNSRNYIFIENSFFL